ncbi:receptor protein kinase-like protein ZAR1 [Impatiens glandulifera]|uniref:receptor protein kinase-like protein ZAR1 n=1 Tax=Impatiens glandulifera TaxID=253017 RepID=UPI001FB0C0E2|nr:receptor protein kinase-like protein ZAR1 [Impatiens glandulifera]
MMMPTFSFLLPLSFFFTAAFSLTPDGIALLSLKSAVDDGGGNALSDWNESDSNPCHWTGISCMNISSFSELRVVGIAVSGKKLRGYIPSELGTLTYLRRLNLHGNHFYGSIPDQLFNASSLHSVFLYGNNLSGHLPPSLCKPRLIQNIDFSNNFLSGEIPKYLGSCRKLQRLILSRNEFTGQIPDGICSELSNLIQLDLSSNNITGFIPGDIGDLKSLSGTLNLSFNHLSGMIPISVGNLPLTVSFNFQNNNLSGEIPQTGSFSNQGPIAFLNNPFLCGFPLQRTCQINSTEIDQTVNNSSTTSKRRLSPGSIVLIAAADAAVVGFIGLVIIYLYWKKKDNHVCSSSSVNENKSPFCPCSRFPNPASEVELEKGGGSGSGSGRIEGGREAELVTIDKGLRIELDELLRSSAYVLGKSGLGIVYKVVLGNGMPVAVRRLGEGGEQRYKEFVAEVQTIGRLKHPNVVKLRAYYWSPHEKLLINDFISNGNLASALHGRTRIQPPFSLSWSSRLGIAKGTARGLTYLHEYSPRKFVHGDIKPSNILLDNEFHPYISDFGLGSLINITGAGAAQQDRWNPYQAPEARVGTGKQATQKWDVYSFGVMLLELLTGKSPESSSTSTEVQDLIRWVRRGFEGENLLSEMVDPFLLTEVDAKKEILSVFHIALECVEIDPEIRPRMKTVSENLGRAGT